MYAEVFFSPIPPRNPSLIILGDTTNEAVAEGDNNNGDKGDVNFSVSGEGTTSTLSLSYNIPSLVSMIHICLLAPVVGFFTTGVRGGGGQHWLIRH